MSSSDALPQLSEYSDTEIAKAKKVSPAIEHYLHIVSQHPNTPENLYRVRRHKAWLECAFATIFKRANAAKVCAYWSNATDSIVREAWHTSGCQKHKLALFALGKWGSQELNLSSDIDIVFVSQENPSTEIIKDVRHFILLLSLSNEFGFCFRVDTDLKPGGRLAPLVCSLKQYEDYYWSSGETWERLALVRMRPIVGSPQVIEPLTETTERFVFRRHIDYSLLDDLKHLRAKIHAHYPQDKAKVRNLKLSPGGIRDIELFIHALQVIHGGKLKNLRTTSTTQAAQALIDEKRFSPADLNLLINNYWQFREFENYVQCLKDLQTHDWSADEHGINEYNFFIGETQKINRIVETVLGRAESSPTLPQDSLLQRQWLSSLGFNQKSIDEKLPELLSLTALSTRTLQDEELRLRVLRQFIERIAEVALDKDLGIALLIDFFRSTRAKTAFFSLLATETRLIRELSVLFGCSPYLGGILAARPELIDSYLYRAQAPHLENFEQMLDALAERRLLNEIIAANQLLQTKNIGQHQEALTASADEICLQLLSSLEDEIGKSNVKILALGKWGGRELGFRSDLDFIFITTSAPTPIDQKISRRFLSRLTESHRGGPIYDVDMRLRPSGKGGPMLVHLDELLHYLRKTAAPWERQSYLKARVLRASTHANIDSHVLIEGQIRGACTSRQITPSDLSELSQIRAKLIRKSEDSIEIKFAAGGLIDIEFAVQIAILNFSIADTPTSTIEMIGRLAEHNAKWRINAPHLTRHYMFLRLVEQVYQLVNQHPALSLNTHSDGLARTASLLSSTPTELSEHIVSQIFDHCVHILKDLDPRNSYK